MPTFFNDADIAKMLADIGVAFVWGSVTTQCLVDYVGQDMLRDMGITGVSGKNITVAVQTSVVAGIKQGALCTVDGVNWKVRDTQQVGDGALTHLLLVSP